MANHNGGSKKSGGGAATAAGIAAALAAAAAGAYWLYGAKDAVKHRKQAKSWMLKARAEIMDAVESLEHVNREQYFGIVDKVAKGYAAAAGGLESLQMRSFLRDVRDTWRYLQEERKKMDKGGAAKRPASSAAKKRPRKSTRSRRTAESDSTS